MSLSFQSLPRKTSEQELEDNLQFLRYFSSRTFDLYSDRTKLGGQDGQGEQEMSYDVLESLYSSFKEEFHDEFVKLEETRGENSTPKNFEFAARELQHGKENFEEVGTLWFSVHNPEKLFKIENRRRHPEAIPTPYIDVITKQNFVKGFENLIRRICIETESENKVIVDKFESWLRSINSSKRIKDAEYLADELRETKRRARQIGLYFYIKDNPSITNIHNAYTPYLDIDQYQNLVSKLIHRAIIDIPIDLAPDEKRKKKNELDSILIQLLNAVANRILPNLTLEFKQEYRGGVHITDLYGIFESVLDKEIIHNLINRYYDANYGSIDSIIRRHVEMGGGRRKKTFRKKKSLKKSGKTKRSKKNRKTNKKK